MHRLQKARPAVRSGEKVDFKFSSFKALQVPKGWDRLYVNIISIETGKTIAKLSAALVRNGTCRWTESFVESIWVSSDHSSKKIQEDSLFKLVLATGSARSGILGEATINLTTYIVSALAPLSVQFPLKKCAYGTILQVKIHCLTPRTQLAENSSIEKKSTNGDSKSCDTASTRTASSCTSKDGDPDLDQREPRSMEESLSASDSHHSYQSAANSIGKESFLSSNNLNGDDNEQESASFNSNNNLLKVAEDSIEELRKEAKTWERNAKKVMLDFDIMRKEYSDQSIKHENLTVELSAACSEIEGLQKEIERMKLLLDKSIEKDSGFQMEIGISVQKEMKEEFEFQKEANGDLAMQLKRSQESNIELLCILQELEVTIEKQKSEKMLLVKDQLLELAVQEMKDEKTNEDNRTILDVETEFKRKLSDKEEEIASLRAKLSVVSFKEEYPAKRGNIGLLREIETLKEKIQILESDCNELTDENFRLLLKLKEMSAKETMETTFCSTTKNLSNGSIKSKPRVGQSKTLKLKVDDEVRKEHDTSMEELERLNVKLEGKVSELKQELAKKSCEFQVFEVNLISKDEDIRQLMQNRSTLDAKFLELEKEKIDLEENMEAFLMDSEIAANCLNDLQNDLTVLSNSVDSHISVNKFLERKSSELQGAKLELELCISGLKQENLQLSDKISDMDSQFSALTVEMESNRLELEKSNNVHYENTQLRNVLEKENTDLKHNLEESNIQLLAVQEEYKSLRREKTSLSKERDALQKSNKELERRNLELHANFADCTKQIKVLEEKLSVELERNAARETTLSVERDAILDENNKYKEKLDLIYKQDKVQIANLLQELENLTSKSFAAESERSRLASQLDELVDESRKQKDELDRRDQKYMEHENELKHLHQLISESDIEVSHLRSMLTESEIKVQGLKRELALSKQNMTKLKTDNDRLLKSAQKNKYGEEKFKITVNDLERKFTVCEFERQQFLQESTNMKMKLQRIEHLEEEKLTLTNKLVAANAAKENLNASLNETTDEYKKLKLEKHSLMEKIATLQISASELEDCQKNRICLEEKLLQMADELATDQTLYAHDPELEHELIRIKKENEQLQKKIQGLEDVIKSMNNEANNQRLSTISIHEEKLATAEESNNSNKGHLKRFTSEGRKNQMRSPRKLTTESELVPSDRSHARTNSSMEAELKDLRERYLNMSLKYAEVEAQREELVMKMKLSNDGRR